MWRIDPGLKLPHKIPLDPGVSSVAAGAGRVWATNELAGLVYRIDPSTNKADVVRRTDGPATVAVGGDAAWVSVAGPPPAGTALPTSVCNQIAAGGEANPRFLIVSDLPLKGSANIATTHQMVEAIQLVLEQRHYRAGAYTVGYQSCDDSTAQGGGWTIDSLLHEREGLREKPRRDRHHRLLQLQLLEGRNPCSKPGRERAAGDDQPGEHGYEVSPASSGVTTTPEDLQHLYPTGKRNFVRTPAGMRMTATAMAQFAKQKGVKRLFLSSNGDPYYAEYAAEVGRAAQSLGIRIAGAAPFDPEARNYERFARAIAATRADGVVLSAYPPPHTRALLRDLRAGLGPRVTLIGGESFQDPTLFRAAAGLPPSGCTSPPPTRTSRSFPRPENGS